MSDKPLQTKVITGKLLGDGQNFQAKLNETLMQLQLNDRTIVDVKYSVGPSEARSRTNNNQHCALILYK